MNYWIFIANYWKLRSGEWIDSREIVRTRAADGFWGLGDRTPNRKWLEKGDKIVWYAGGSDSQIFMGTATLASPSYKLDGQRLAEVSHGREEYEAEYGVDLDDIELWPAAKPAKDIVPNLTFVQNKDYWGSYLQGGVRAISPEDYLVITEGVRGDLAHQMAKQTDLVSASEFALEQHLEEFIHTNWKSIDFGCSLRLYEAEGQNGRQFPAGPPGSNWSIDFLAIDQDSEDLVVIELKRGKTSDAVAGQVLRYMGWVRENVAATGQNVRGLVIAKSIDDALRYALSAQTVDVKTYEVDFRLKDGG